MCGAIGRKCSWATQHNIRINFIYKKTKRKQNKITDGSLSNIISSTRKTHYGTVGLFNLGIASIF